MSSSKRLLSVVDWALRLLAAGILFQTLFFKFTGAEESVYIFSKLGMEPWGRLGSGVAELVCGVLLLLPFGVVPGALLTIAVLSGALAAHLGPLGIVVLGDGGLLFGLAVTATVACLLVLLIHGEEVPFVGERLAVRRRRRRAARGGDSIASQTSCSLKTGAGETCHRVLVLGGGFGGVYTALELERLVGDREDVEVTLVNRENFFLFTPMLHEVAASDLDLVNIVSPIRKLLPRTEFFQGDVTALDLARRRATLRHGTDGHDHVVQYDQLVLALGSVTNYFGLPGLAEQALTMKSLGDAMDLRNRLIARLEEADTECAGEVRRPLLTFLVAGGGFAGVETIAGVNDFLRSALPWYPHLAPEDLRVVLVHPGEVILPELGEKLGRYAQEKLSRRGVEIRTGTRVTSVDPEGVGLSDGTRIPARTVVWTAGTSPHPLVATLPTHKERGRVLVDESLEVPEFPGVFALGDCAAVPDVRGGGFHPPTAQHAIREARVAARNVAAAIAGGAKRRFEFTTIGQLAAIGRRTGVARVFGVNFSGFLAWWLWRTIYLAKLPRAEKKLRCMLDWTLDLVFSKDLVQFLHERAPVIPGDAASREAAPPPAAGVRF